VSGQCASPAPIEVITVDRPEPIDGTNVASS
jgi:hypothetical protein